MASYSDNFDRTSLGADWVSVTGGWYIEGSDTQTIRGSNFTGGYPIWCAYATPLDSSNHWCSFKVKSLANQYAHFAPAVRVQDTTNRSGYFWRYRQQNADSLLIRIVSGANTTLASAGNGINTDEHVLKLEADGAIFRAYDDDVLKLEYEDLDFSSYLGTYVGCAANDTSTALSKGDDFLAEDLAAPAYNVTLSNPLAAANGQNDWSGSCDVAYA